MTSESPAAILYDQYGNPITIVNGAIAVSQISSTGTITAVNAVNTDTLLLLPNSNRRGVFIYNNTTSATLKLGLTPLPVSSTAFSVMISSGGLFEIPFGYTGEIRGIWSINEMGGYVNITELT
jgi:hypothetical protein